MKGAELPDSPMTRQKKASRALILAEITGGNLRLTPHDDAHEFVAAPRDRELDQLGYCYSAERANAALMVPSCDGVVFCSRLLRSNRLMACPLESRMVDK